uniref:SSD domain-containing protein n=1 Tax=Ditylenchus dipsaci TaxID=166011 RepID=A0A915DQW4_9BILA
MFSPFSRVLQLVQRPLVLGVGIDDAFIMTAAWNRTNPQLSVVRRLAKSLAEAAVYITITSLTDMLTFGILVISLSQSSEMSSSSCSSRHLWQP